VQFDLLNASANPVLHQLRRLDLDSVGSVTVGQVNVVLDGPPSAAAERQYARREQVPVWEMVEGTIRANASYPPSFYLLLIIAGLIGLTGEPVPPGSRSGAMTHRNDQRPACSQAGASSTKSR
jgi:hypothetical protein